MLRRRFFLLFTLFALLFTACGSKEPAPSGVLSGFESPAPSHTPVAEPTPTPIPTPAEPPSPSLEASPEPEYEPIAGQYYASSLELGVLYGATRDVRIANDTGVPLYIEATYYNVSTGTMERGGLLLGSTTLLGGYDESTLITGAMFTITAPEKAESAPVFKASKVARLSEAKPGNDLVWLYKTADFFYNDTESDLVIRSMLGDTEYEITIPAGSLVRYRSGDSDACMLVK